MDSTLAKGLAVLDWLARQPKGARVSDVAAAFGLARSNAHRTLRTLVGCGFAQQDEATSVYGASLRLFELGTLVGAANDVQARLRPRLQALADPSGLFNSSLDGKVRRAIDVREGDDIDEAAFKTLIRAAAALNAQRLKKS